MVHRSFSVSFDPAPFRNTARIFLSISRILCFVLDRGSRYPPRSQFPRTRYQQRVARHPREPRSRVGSRERTSKYQISIDISNEFVQNPKKEKQTAALSSRPSNTRLRVTWPSRPCAKIRAVCEVCDESREQRFPILRRPSFSLPAGFNQNDKNSHLRRK